MKCIIPLELAKEGMNVTVNKINIAGSLGVRLRDLGFVEGAIVEPLYGGRGIRAYGICGTVIALRNTDAAFVEVTYE